MVEKEPIRSPRKGTNPLIAISKPLDKPDVLTQENAFVDQVLIYQGAKPTEANRQSLRSKIESIQQHRN